MMLQNVKKKPNKQEETNNLNAQFWSWYILILTAYALPITY